MPFVTTGTNIIRKTSESVPFLNFTTSEGYKIFSKIPVERDKAIARLMLGSTAIFTGAMLAEDGTINGSSPTKTSERNIKLNSGEFEPNSIRVGTENGRDQFVSLEPFELMAMPYILGADLQRMAQTLSDKDAKGTKLFEETLNHSLAILQNLTLNKTYMRQFSDFTKAVFSDDKVGAFARFGSQHLATATPGFAGLQGNLGLMIDPLLKQRNNFVEQYRARLPLYNQILEYSGAMGELSVKRNLLGQEIPLSSGKFLDGINPFYVHSRKKEPILKAMIDLKHFPGMPSTKSVIRGVELSSQSYDEFLKDRGERIRLYLGPYVSHPNFNMQVDDTRGDDGISKKMINDHSKKQIIDSMLRKASGDAKKILLFKAASELRNNPQSEKYKEIKEHILSPEFKIKQAF
jgi:hypothetical protein